MSASPHLANFETEKSKPEIICLPELGQMYIEGVELKMVELAVTPKLTIAKMKPYLDAYNLGHSAKRDILIERLRDLAKTPSLWTSQFQSTPSRVRGGTLTSARSQTRGSSKRYLEMFGAEQSADPAQVEHPSKRVAISVPDDRTSADIAKSIALARHIVTLAEAQDSSSTVSQGIVIEAESSFETDPAGGQPSTSSALTEHIISPAVSAAVQRELIGIKNAIKSQFGITHTLIIQHGLGQGLAHTGSSTPRDCDYSVLTSAPSAASSSLNPPTLHHTEITSDSAPLSSSSRGPSMPLPLSGLVNHPWPPTTVATSAETRPEIALEDPSHVAASTDTVHACTTDCRSITLASGESIHFRSADLRPPPAVSFADDVPRLFREWYQSTAIILDGRGIPVGEWDQLYKKKIAIPTLSKAWNKYRSTWGNWKFIVSEFERLGSDETKFWDKFKTDQGVRMKYQEILDHLLMERKGKDTELGYVATSVKDFFGGDLRCSDAGSAFTYKKNGHIFTVSKNEEVVSRFNDLRSQDAELQARWEIFQSTRT